MTTYITRLLPMTTHSSLFRSWRRLLSSATSELDYGYSATNISKSIDTRMASIALVGLPNAGKSSLANSMIENRISAVSRKRNTTRSRNIGAYTQNNCQLLFWDAPGILERQLMAQMGNERRELTSAAWGSAADADVALMVVDGSKGHQYWEKCANIANQLADMRQKVRKQQNKDENQDEAKPEMILVLNKSDRANPRSRLLLAADFFQEKIENFQSHFEKQVFMVSAYNGRGVHELRDHLVSVAPPGEFEVEAGTSYCEDDLDVIREQIWEKLLHRIHDELPYRSHFENESYIELPTGDLYVAEKIIVPRRSAIQVVVGTNGRVIEWIRDEAAKSSSISLDRKVHLKLRVVSS